jgi:uncharacterized protein (TIGR03084 family)
MTLPISIDLRDEARELHAFLETLDSADWSRPTLFMDWTPWDIVSHLHYFDRVSLDALEGEEAFASHRRQLMEAVAAGKTTKALQLEAFEGVSAPDLLERWRAGCEALAEKLGACSPKTRLPWFGPDMGAPMFTTARYMETWSHAQAIYDVKGVRRTHTDRIRNVVEIGRRTFGWTFVNRGLEVPGPPPFLRLEAPSGAIWEYGEPSDDERIEGSALDFCLTVTQVRNVADTALRVRGEVATRWMAIAQCFAGKAVDPPPPGHRTGG